MPRFGEQRLVRSDVTAAHRLLFRLMGVPDPAHYLHSVYLRRALKGLGRISPRLILDAGCGTGDYCIYLARRYPEAVVVGLDIDRGCVTRARRAARALGVTNVHFAVGDLAQAAFRKQFDVLVSIDVLEHIVEQDVAIANLAAALRDGGIVFLHMPTVRERPVPLSRWLSEFHAWGEREHVAQERTSDAFGSAIKRAGLQVISTTPTFGYGTGELATSLFALPYRNTPINRVLQGLLAPLCRLLSMADTLQIEHTRYAVAVTARKGVRSEPAEG